MFKKIKPTLKAGCILVNPKNQKIGLIFRENHNDYEFAKGHLEAGESLRECAIRETAEETKRTAEPLNNLKPLVEKYTNRAGEKCKCYLFISTDVGKSDNSSEDTHKLIWVNFEEVEQILSYNKLKRLWRKAKKLINKHYKI